MILKGSFSFNKNLMTTEEPKEDRPMSMKNSMSSRIPERPDPLQIVQRVESIDEMTEEDRDIDEEVKPRRKYIPAQDKIQLELKEQSKRENELSQLRAKWKSTPDLSNTDKDNENNDLSVEADSMANNNNSEMDFLTKPSVMRRQISSSTQKLTSNEDMSTSDVLRMNKPTVRRRQSALINQWEEMIKQQQQKQNKN